MSDESERADRLDKISTHKAWEDGANPALDKTRNAEEKILNKETKQKPAPEYIQPSFAKDRDGYADTEVQRPQWDRADKAAAARKAARSGTKATEPERKG